MENQQITGLINRYSVFFQLHDIGDDLFREGTNAWRAEGAAWADTYQIKSGDSCRAPDGDSDE